MSRFISELLGAREPIFSLSIRQLESMTGQTSIDVRLTSEIIQKLKAKTAELGLDVCDTTGRELYHGLMNHLKDDSKRFDNQQGLSEASFEVAVKLVIDIANNSPTPKNCWVLKRSVAKELLKKTPPKTVMRRLNHKSIDSLLKNENIFEVYSALRFAESPAWLTAFNKKYKSLTPSDFESRPVNILLMPQDKWSDLAKPFTIKKLHFVTHLKEMGVIAVLPPSQSQSPGINLVLLLLLLHYINEIRLYSSFFKLNQVKPDFATILINTLNDDFAPVANLAGQTVHWRVVQRYWGKPAATKHPEMFEPHVQPEDLEWRQAEQTLFNLDSEFKWWQQLDYVGLNDVKPVSLNLIDMALNYYLQNDYQKRLYYHMRESLWNELLTRYLGEKVVENQLLKQLDHQMIEPETILKTVKPKGI